MTRPAFLIPFLAAALLAGGCSKAPESRAEPQGQAAGGQSAPAAVAPVSSAHAQSAPQSVGGQAIPDFSAIVEANKAAVVNITSTINPAAAGRSAPQMPGGESQDEGEDNPFSDFLRRFQGQMPPVPQQGMGSGFVVGADGVILTNAHVVEGADQVRVKLTDRREFKGKVVGVDKQTDIAVVRIEAKGL